MRQTGVRPALLDGATGESRRFGFDHMLEVEGAVLIAKCSRFESKLVVLSPQLQLEQAECNVVEWLEPRSCVRG
jgi:hypothetical protein